MGAFGDLIPSGTAHPAGQFADLVPAQHPAGQFADLVPNNAGPVRSADQTFGDSLTKAILTGPVGYLDRRILETFHPGITKPAGMSDAQFKSLVHQTILAKQQDVLQPIAQRDAANPMFGKNNGGPVGTAEHLALSGVANLAGNPLNLIGGPGETLAGRLAGQGLVNAGVNAVDQGLNVSDQSQDKFHPEDVAASGVAGVVLGGVHEGIGAGVKGVKNFVKSRIQPEVPSTPDFIKAASDEGVPPPAQTPEPAGRGVPTHQQGAFDDLIPSPSTKSPVFGKVAPDTGVAPEGWQTADRTIMVGGPKDASIVPPHPNPETEAKIQASMPPTITSKGELSHPFSFDQDVYNHRPEVLQHIADNLHDKSLPEAAQWMRDNSTGGMQTIFGRVADRLHDLDSIGVRGKVEVGRTEEDQQGSNSGETFFEGTPDGLNFGVKLRDPNLQVKGDTPGTSPGVVLHEMVHATTLALVDAVQRAPKRPELAPFVRPVNDLEQLWAHVAGRAQEAMVANGRASMPSSVSHGNFLDNPHELLAWGLSDPEAQGFLKSIPYKTTNAWSKFVDTVRRFMGIKPSDSHAMGALLDTFDRLTPDRNGVYGPSEYQRAHQVYDQYGRLTGVSAPMAKGRDDEEETPAEGRVPPDKAGNINLDRMGLHDAEGAKQAIRDAAEQGGLNSVTHAELIGKAEKLAERFSDDQLLLRNPRLSTAPEYSLAIRGILNRTSKDYVASAEKVNSDLTGENGKASSETLAEFDRLRLKLATAVERDQKLRNVAGRMLNQYRVMLDRYGHGLPPGAEEVDLHTLARMVSAQAKVNPAAVNQAARDSFKPGFWDYAKSAVYNLHLASLAPHVSIFTANAGNLFGSLLNHAVTAAVSEPTRFTTNDRVAAREVIARMYGAWRSLQGWKALSDAGFAFKTGHPSGQAAKVQTRIQYPGAWDYILQGPSKGIAAADQFWATILQTSDIHGMAVRTAIKEGLKGKAFEDRVTDLSHNPSTSLMKHAAEYSRQIQMMDDPSPLGKLIEKANATPPKGSSWVRQMGSLISNTLMAFPRITDGMFRTAVRSSLPLGLLDRYNRADLAAGGARRALALGRMSIGTAAMAYTGMVAQNFIDNPDAYVGITGDGPANYQKRQEWLASGARPNSIKVGDTYYSTAMLGPAAIPMNVIATTLERWKNGELKEDGVVNDLLGTMASVGSSLSHNDFTRSLGNIFEALQPGESGKSARANLISAPAKFLEPPSLGAVNQTFFDKAQRDTRGNGDYSDLIKGNLEGSVPGLSNQFPQKMDVYGRPVDKDSTFLTPIVTRMTMSPVDRTAAVQEVAKLQRVSPSVLVGPPEKSLKGYDEKDQPTTKKLSSEEFENYQHLSGQYILQGIHESMQDPAWSTAPNQDKIDAIKSIVKDARSQARDDLFFSDADHAKQALKFSFTPGQGTPSAPPTNAFSDLIPRSNK